VGVNSSIVNRRSAIVDRPAIGHRRSAIRRKNAETPGNFFFKKKIFASLRLCVRVRPSI
jgi:hypothetical protein